MASDLQASTAFTATGQLTRAEDAANIGRCRIKAIQFVCSGAGSLTFRDGGASGTTRFVLTLPVGTDHIALPDDGVLFRTSPHVTVTGTLTGATVFYTG